MILSRRCGFRALLAVAAAGAGALALSAKSNKPEEIPSEDTVIPRLHSLGLIDGRTDIYRCACPTTDVAKSVRGRPSVEDMAAAKARMQRIYDLGIRTVISLENQTLPKWNGQHADAEPVALYLERSAAKSVGLTYLAFPMSGRGPHSLEDMSDEAVLKLLDGVANEIFRDARNGGVIFHCKAGHDRTGILAAYLRIKYQGWSADQAIAEMRRDGHNWPEFSKPGAQSSWLEDHVRAIAAMLRQGQAGGAALPLSK